MKQAATATVADDRHGDGVIRAEGSPTVRRHIVGDRADSAPMRVR
jgi:hypothetical protein